MTSPMSFGAVLAAKQTKRVKIPWIELQEALEADMLLGFCLGCGVVSDGCEPDMRGGRCHACDLCEVFGAEEVLVMGAHTEEEE